MVDKEANESVDIVPQVILPLGLRRAYFIFCVLVVAIMSAVMIFQGVPIWLPIAMVWSVFMLLWYFWAAVNVYVLNAAFKMSFGKSFYVTLEMFSPFPKGWIWVIGIAIVLFCVPLGLMIGFPVMFLA